MTSTTKQKAIGQGQISVTELTICGAFTALVCVLTMFIQIQIIPAEGGMVHLGNVPLFFAAAFFGKRVGAVCGGLGMALSDLLSGWTMWAPGTLIVVGIMGFVFGLIVNKKPTFVKLLLAVFAVLGIKLVGYYVFEVLMTGNWIAPWLSVPGNVLQIATAAIISIPLILASGVAVKKVVKSTEEEIGE